MNVKQTKRKRDIKTKLMAAVSMLLVSSIMMVSTTYAWFTLSTAPEVTGITTAVGANGNLEMALLPTAVAGEPTINATDFGIKSGVEDSYASTGDYKVSNITWGNLVNLSDGYGLDNITLYPSALNVDATGVIGTNMLKTPEYGADGRVSALNANTVQGTYKDGSFMPNSEYGVRAVGVSSGMTEREFAYSNAVSAAQTAMRSAKNDVTASLQERGSVMGSIVVKKGLDGDAATFTQDEVDAISGALADLTAVVNLIEDAYMQYIVVYATTTNGGTDDIVWRAVKSAVESSETLADVKAAFGEVALPAELDTYFGRITGMKTKIAAATDAVPSGKDSYTWGDIDDALTPLFNTDSDNVNVNGWTLAQIKANMSGFQSHMFNNINNVTINMGTGSGIYADIADQVGSYDASINVEAEIGGVALDGGIPARMYVNTSINPVYLNGFGSYAKGSGAHTDATAANPLSEFYGYIIDLAFRTNAASSNLLLSAEGRDRIYSDNTNDETMGNGSTMTFKAPSNSFLDSKVKDLMKAIRIVFFDASEGNQVIANAKLDVDNAKTTADGFEAEMYIYTVSEGISYEAATYEENSGKTYYIKETVNVYTKTEDTAIDGNKTYYDADGNAIENPVVEDIADYYELGTEDKHTSVSEETAKDAPAGTLYVQVPAGSDVRSEDNAIMALTQNSIHQLSVLVYLDGNKITNADVAADVAKSLTGKMNLQFASSAELIPMEYAELHQVEKFSVTVPTGVKGDNSVTKGSSYTFTLEEGYTLGEVRINDAAIAPGTITEANGEYTIPAASITGDIVIAVTPPASGS